MGRLASRLEQLRAKFSRTHYARFLTTEPVHMPEGLGPWYEDLRSRWTGVIIPATREAVILLQKDRAQNL